MPVFNLAEQAFGDVISHDEFVKEAKQGQNETSNPSCTVEFIADAPEALPKIPPDVSLLDAPSPHLDEEVCVIIESPLPICNHHYEVACILCDDVCVLRLNQRAINKVCKQISTHMIAT